jgi:hypothetical protein
MDGSAREGELVGSERINAFHLNLSGRLGSIASTRCRWPLITFHGAPPSERV